MRTEETDIDPATGRPHRAKGYRLEPRGDLDDILGAVRPYARTGARPPEESSLIEYLPPYKPQKSTSTCVAVSSSNIVECDLRSKGWRTPPTSSRQMFTLANELLRRYRGEPLSPFGTYPRMLWQACKWGVAQDADWPLFDEIGRPNDVTQDVPPDVLQKASAWKLKEPFLIDSEGDSRVMDVVEALGVLRQPLTAAGVVDRAFDLYDGRGVLTAPEQSQDLHQVGIVKYRLDRTTGRYIFTIVNQWDEWGFDGPPGSDVHSLAEVDEDWIKSRHEIYRVEVEPGPLASRIA